MDLWTFGGADKFTASTWFGLRHARLKVVALQPTVIFESFVFEAIPLLLVIFNAALSPTI